MPNSYFTRAGHLSWAFGYIAATCLVVLAGGCAEREPYQQQSYVFGTLVDITLYGESEAQSKRLANEVFAIFDRLHHSFHAWQPSELTDLNNVFSQGPQRAKISPLLKQIIVDTTRFSVTSGGLFNPAIGKLVALWGFHNDDFKPMQPDTLKIARIVKAHPQLMDIVIVGNEAYSTNPAVQLDLGGYLKGYALDLAAQHLREQGVKDALLNIGGNIMALGKHENRAWRVGIQHPRKAGIIATVELHDGEALATSGDYQRYFISNGKRYCHIIDPNSGYPAQGMQSVTVLVHTGLLAGALSDAATKPLFIAGLTNWKKASSLLGMNSAMLIDGRGAVHVTPSMSKHLQFTDASTVAHILQ